MTENVLKLVSEERARQNTKWGEQNHSPAFWAVILGEEYGEVCRAIYENDPTQYVAELVQLAAVCVAMVEAHQRQYAQPREEVSPAYSARVRLGEAVKHAKNMLNEYNAIGTPGYFGATLISVAIEKGESALRNDVSRESMLEIASELEAIQ